MTDAKIDLIAKLLAKAEAAGTTPAERDALSEKAGELMIKYGIDEAVARAARTGEVRSEEIIKTLTYTDVPRSYSHEYAVLGCRVAENFGVKGILATGNRQKGTGVYFIGFRSDVELVTQLYRSLVRQCTLNLAPWYRNQTGLITGTERYNAKRGFINGFATGVGAKLAQIRRQVIDDAGPSTALVVRDRARNVDAWIDEHMSLSSTRGRRYDVYARGAGYAAGQRADVGQGTVSQSVPRRNAIGG